MAKTESTAVNELISLVNENQGLKRMSEPADDLFGPPKKTSVNPPRMTGTIPPMRGAGEVAPLPRTRAAGGTSQHKLPDVPPPPNVRMVTAPPTRGQTIPPIPQQRASAPIPPAIPTRASSPGLPSPIRNTASAPVISQPRVPALQPSHARPDSKPTLPMPKGTRPPASAPIAAPFEPTPTNAAANPFVAMPLGYPVVQRAPQPVARIDMTGDAVSAENWFEHSRAVEKFEEETYVGTSPIKRQERAQTATLVKKMIAPTIALVIVGIMIGGFIAFNGEGGKKHVAKQPAVAQAEPVQKAVAPITAPAAAPARSPESANAATATAGGEQPEPPAKTEPTAKADEPAAKADEPVAKPEPVAVAKPEPVAVAKPEPAAKAAASVREVQTTRGVVKLADVRIDSKPSGATVMLVDNGKTSFLGTTPLATSLDPSRPYDVIFTIQGKPTQMAHLDPAKTPHLDIVLGKTATTAATAPAPAVAKPTPAPAPAPTVAKPTPAPVAHHHHAAAPVATKASAPPPTGTLADPGFDTPAPAPAPKADKVDKVEKAAKTEAPAAKAEPAVKAPTGATGTLMVSSKPPCEIVIDGKSTGLSTPQRAISLSPGAHKITFVNTAQNINKSVAVSISADQTTKLVKDLIAQ